MLRESQQSAHSETFVPPAGNGRNTDTIERPSTIADTAHPSVDWLAEERARLFALRRVENLEVDPGEPQPPRDALREDEAIALREPGGASLTSQLSTGQGCDRIAEMAMET